MLLTISTTHKPATDLGFLLHKNPARAQSFPLSVGQAWVFYVDATEHRCTAALLLDIDPVALIRDGRPRGESRATILHYVYDRPYVASSFMSVAIGEVFGTAMSGRSKERQELADSAIPLEIRLAAVAAKGGDALLRRLFEPLGYEVTARSELLDAHFPEWGESRYLDVTLKGMLRVRDALIHISVLLSVLDDEKHYFVGDDEVTKLLRRGEGWLAGHPDRALISTRYLKHRRSLIRIALERLMEEDSTDEDDAEETNSQAEEAIERPIRLHDLRLDASVRALVDAGAHRIVDLGCGSGQLIERLAKESSVREILGVDVALNSLERAQRRLRLDRPGSKRQERMKLIHGSLIYRDRRIEGFDGAAATEVIEHLDPFRLDMFRRVLFEFARPATVVITTPNREYNDLFPTLANGAFRHRDHRFEWTRAEFQTWATAAAESFGYGVSFQGIGLEDPERGAPSQMAVFTHEAK